MAESDREFLLFAILYGGKFSASGGPIPCSFGFETLYFGSYDRRTNVTKDARFRRIGGESAHHTAAEPVIQSVSLLPIRSSRMRWRFFELGRGSVFPMVAPCPTSHRHPCSASSEKLGRRGSDCRMPIDAHTTESRKPLGGQTR